MNSFFQRFDPALREQVAAIDFQAEQARDASPAALFSALELQREQAAKTGLTPYYLRPMQGCALSGEHGPYAVRPQWNAERRQLELAFVSTRHGLTPETPESARYALPPHIYAKALQHHRESVLESLKAQFAGVAPGGVIRAKAVGAESIRDFLREQHLEISLSFAAALFATITQLDAH